MFINCEYFWQATVEHYGHVPTASIYLFELHALFWLALRFTMEIVCVCVCCQQNLIADKTAQLYNIIHKTNMTMIINIEWRSQRTGKKSSK